MIKAATKIEQIGDGTLLNAARVAASLSYAELGRKLGCSRATARRYCLGERIPARGPGGPAERLAAWSGGEIHLGNFDKPAPKPRRVRRR